MEKIDFKKKYKDIYRPSSKKPSIITVPKFNFAYIIGEGDPNTSQAFSDAIGALYALSYTIRMSYKNDFIIPSYYEYMVPPLEGIWDIMAGKKFDYKDKSVLMYRIGIVQPEFVTDDIFAKAQELAFLKKKLPMINDIQYKPFEDGLCCTYMHLGPFDDERASFEIMEDFIKENGLIRIEKSHREIYLSDFRRTSPEKLKTILRIKVK